MRPVFVQFSVREWGRHWWFYTSDFKYCAEQQLADVFFIFSSVISGIERTLIIIVYADSYLNWLLHHMISDISAYPFSMARVCVYGLICDFCTAEQKPNILFLRWKPGRHGARESRPLWVRDYKLNCATAGWHVCSATSCQRKEKWRAEGGHSCCHCH